MSSERARKNYDVDHDVEGEKGFEFVRKPEPPQPTQNNAPEQADKPQERGSGGMSSSHLSD